MTTHKFDFVVIGSGPAGSVLSDELAKKGFKIAMIDRARNKSPQIINDFFAPYIKNSPNYYTPVYSNTLGGNSILWHSKIYLLSKSEIESHKWLVDYNSLKKNSNQLSKKFNLGLKKDLLTKIKKKNGKIFRTSHRAKFRNIFEYLKINENKNIKVFRGFSPIKLSLKNTKINSLLIKDTKYNLIKIEIKNDLIFCCGGLGNPHLLLNLLGKFNKNLGKFLSDHPHINLGRIKNSEVIKFKKILKPNIKKNINDKKYEEAMVLKNKKYFCGVQLDYKLDPAKQLIRMFIKIKNLKLRIVLNLFNFLLRKINGIFFMMGIIFSKYYKYSFEFFFSQNLDSKNRVFLSNAVDEFGLKKINISWDLNKNDYSNYVKLIRKVSETEKVKIEYKELLKNFYKNGLAGQHPSCTTKIGTNISNGVVDKNLKIFGIKNAHVVGSSVFPFNGYTNPTWTIMTLAYRLSKKLIKNRK